MPYFNRVTPVKDFKNAFNITRSVGIKGAYGDYMFHQIVWDLMVGRGSSQKRDFLYRIDMQGGWPVFLIISAKPPVGSSSSAWTIETKEYSPCLNRGDVLDFSVRFSPIISKRNPSGKPTDRGMRVDAVCEAANQFKNKNEGYSLHSIIHEQSLNWLNTKGDKSGFELIDETFVAEKYQVSKFFKNKQTEDRPVSIPMVDANGRLIVRDPESFVRMLFTGIGKGKGFGCGMMMVKRAY